jgi:hypothetical protein
MIEALFGMKAISNQRLLAHSDQVLSMFKVHFIEAVKKMGHGYNCIEFKYKIQ